MKSRKSILKSTTLLLSAFLLVGCAEKEPEEIIPTFYNQGIYAPEDGTYELALPSAKWAIAGDENPEDITFVLSKNEITVKRYKDTSAEYKDKTSSIPTTQDDLEEQLKENGIKNYTITTFKSNVYFDDSYNLSTTRYYYDDEGAGVYKVFNSIIDDNYLYEITGKTDSDDTLEQILTTVNNFLLSVQDEKTKVFNIKENKLDGNTYKSKNSDFALTLPYDDWKFDVKDDFSADSGTNIFTDEINITIKKQSKMDQSNTIVYEIPTTLDILNKQIEMKNFGEYEVLDFKVNTIGTLPEYDETQDYTVFSYLIKCKDNQEMKYYAYTEYRNEYTTYQLTGILTKEDEEKAAELNEILKSFYPTSMY